MNTFFPLFFILFQNKRTKGQSKFMTGKFRKNIKKMYFAPHPQHGGPLWNSTFAESNFRAVVFKGSWVDLMPQTMLAVDRVKIKLTKSCTSGLRPISAEAKEIVFFSLLLSPSATEPKNPGVLPLASGPLGSQHDQYVTDNPRQKASVPQK